MRIFAALSLCALLCWAGSQVLGEEVKGGQARWPQFRGPGAQGIGGDGLRLPAQLTKVVWRTALPAGHSSPCIWDDHIYVTGFDQQAKKLETICLNRSNGKILWRQAAPAGEIENVHTLNTPASSTPACDGEQVYVYFGSYGLLCFSKDGELKWKRPLQPILTGFGSGTSPAVAGDLVLLNSGIGKEKLSLLAIDHRTGKTVWQQDRPRGTATGLWSTPVIRPGPDGEEVIVAGGQQVAAYRLTDGALHWQVSGLPFISLGTPALGEDMVFLTLTSRVGDPDENVVKLPSFDELLKKYDKNKDGKLSVDELPDDLVFFTRGRSDKIGDWAKVRDAVAMFDKDKDKALSRQEWQEMLQGLTKITSDMQIAAAGIRLEEKGKVSLAQVAWKEAKSVPEVPSPLYYQGRVYLISDKGIVTCRHAQSGKEVYRERLGGRGSCYSSPVLGDGKIYVGTDGGVLVVFKPGDRFQVLARNDLKEGIVATPALVDNKIYLRTFQALYAFGE
jgi:outer membrane protein assembly factor BamB